MVPLLGGQKCHLASQQFSILSSRSASLTLLPTSSGVRSLLNLRSQDSLMMNNFEFLSDVCLKHVLQGMQT